MDRIQCVIELEDLYNQIPERNLKNGEGYVLERLIDKVDTCYNSEELKNVYKFTKESIKKLLYNEQF